MLGSFSGSTEEVATWVGQRVLVLSSETAKLAEREPPRASSDTVLVDVNAGAEMATTDAL